MPSPMRPRPPSLRLPQAFGGALLEGTSMLVMSVSSETPEAPSLTVRPPPA